MKKKNLVPALLLTPVLAFSNLAYAQESEQAPQKKSTVDKISNAIEDQWKTAKLKYSTNILNKQTANGFGITLDNTTKSEPSLGDKYSGIDIWDLGLSFFPTTLSEKLGATAGISTHREITFIQQFNSRQDSVLRLGYNPVTKLPTNSERALKLHEGDFVAFRAPLSFSLGKTLTHELAKRLNFDASLSPFVSGEFDVHIFRMKDNRVRVKLVAIRDKGVTLSAGMGIGGLNLILVSSIVDLRPIEAYIGTNKSDLFSVDYIFNLNDDVAKKEYDNLIGQKYRMSSFQLAGMNPLSKDERVKDLLYSDLSSVQNVVEQDNAKSDEDRRIIRLAMGENESRSWNMGIKFNLKVVKAKVNNRSTTSRVSLYDIKSDKQNFLLKSRTEEVNGELFWVWGGESRHEVGLLSSADEKFNPKEMVGLHSHRSSKRLSMSASQYESFKNRIKATLPEEITSQITFPDFPANRSSIGDVRIQQDIFFNTETLSSLRTMNYETIRAHLIKIVKGWGELSVRPESSLNGSDVQDPRMAAYQRGNYEDAFEVEIQSIPNYMTIVLDEKRPMNERLEAYDYLNNIPLFNEVGGALILSLIPKQSIEKAISYRLSISANKMEGKQFFYPTIDHQQNMNVFLNVMANNTYISDRSFNLGLYLNEKGEPYSVKEIMQRTKF